MNSTIPADLLELNTRFETWRTNMNFRRACARHFASSVSSWPLQLAASASDIWIGLPNSALRAFNNS
jgi:hypothetical protein